MVLMNPFQGNNGDVDIENRCLWTRATGREGGEGGTNGESNMQACMLPCAKQTTNEICCMTSELNQMVTTSRGMGRKLRRGLKREGTHMYTYGGFT